MRWPWVRKRGTSELDEAQAAVEESQRKLDETRAVQPEVTQLVRQLHDLRQRNNFAAMIAAALREHR